MSALPAFRFHAGERGRAGEGVARFLILVALIAATLADAGTNPKKWHPLEAAPGLDAGTVGYGVEASVDDPEAPLLVCRCQKGTIDLFLIADTTAIGPGTSHRVNVFVDEEPARIQRWLGTTENGALFAPEPLPLLGRMERARALELGIPGARERFTTLLFDVRGFAEPLAHLRRGCPPAPAPSEAENPPFGAFVYVEELPEAISKVPPEYPAEARASRMEGTVVVQALVGTDGTVHDTKTVKSVPVLDAAAEASVRKWTFKPAMAKGRPVAVWVAVPVKFSLP